MPEHRESDVKKDDRFVTPAATGEATLAGLEGRGLLSLVYDSDGNLHETQGSWFPAGGPTDITRLSSAKQEGRTVTYRGPIDIAQTAGLDEEIDREIDREVRITGVREYTDEDGGERVLVSFELVDDAGAGSASPDRSAAGTGKMPAVTEPQLGSTSDRPDQYTYEEFMALDLRTIADLTGHEPKVDLGATTEAEFRQKAWESYELDIENRDEWGTARQGTKLPKGG